MCSPAALNPDSPAVTAWPQPCTALHSVRAPSYFICSSQHIRIPFQTSSLTSAHVPLTDLPLCGRCCPCTSLQLSLPPLQTHASPALAMQAMAVHAHVLKGRKEVSDVTHKEMVGCQAERQRLCLHTHCYVTPPKNPASVAGLLPTAAAPGGRCFGDAGSRDTCISSWPW